MLKKINYGVLLELDKNSRQNCSEIAKKLNTSKQVINYHLNLLTTQGVIKKFLTIFDLSKLDMILHKIYLRLVNITEEKEIELVNFLKIHKNVAWLIRTEGIYDIAFALHTKDIRELNTLLLEIENKYGFFISEKIVNRVISGEFFPRNHLTNEKIEEFRKGTMFQTYETKHILDDIDWKIMTALSKNSRISALDISKNTSISADAIGKRIKNLEKSGVIKKYILVLNDSKLEQLHYKILLKIAHFDEKVERKFIEFCRNNKNITFYNTNIGSWEVEFDMEVKKSEEFREMMRILKSGEFSGYIKEYFSLIVYDVVKFDFIPMMNLSEN